MGSLKEEICRDEGELLHQVSWTKRFWLCQTEVTKSQWLAVMGETQVSLMKKKFLAVKISQFNFL